MEQDYKDKGVVLVAYDSGENDRVLKILTEKAGKLSVIAKGARRPGKRKFNQLEPFECGEFKLLRGARSSMYRVTNYSINHPAPAIRENLDRFLVATFCCELVNSLTREESPSDGPLTELVTLLIKTLQELTDTREILRAGFICSRSTLSQLGLLAADFPNTPTAHNLIRIARRAEEETDRPLKSLPHLVNMIQRLRAG